MIGWWIVVDAQTPEECDASIGKPRATVLASWEASSGGIDWLKHLTNEGKATQLSNEGYPNRYTANAGDVTPILTGGMLDADPATLIGDYYMVPGGWKSKIKVHHDKIAACPADQLLTIDAWDLS